ncbi:TPA: hypothetical protein U2I64_004136, partial [Providencia stuartii]|nr:hypothetical protein [Providencia stuartii]HEM8132506.1 hypothetical protein [Providencia stuartii]
MGNEFFAAKQGDKLMHSSIWADIVCGVVKGAVYAAVGAAAVVLTGVTGGAAAAVFIGAGLATGFALGSVIDAAADWVADGIDSLFGLSSPDGEIKTGSPNVRIKGKLAARAAGKLPTPLLLASIAEDNAPPKEKKGLDIALSILEKSTMLIP